MLQLNHPKLLVLLIVPAVLFFYFLLKQRKKEGSFVFHFSFFDEVIMRFIARTRLMFRVLFLVYIFIAGCIIVAICQPVKKNRKTHQISEGIDIVLVLDVSESMEATDLTPNRMVAAKKVIEEFILARKYDRIALVIFGGESVTKAPLTTDKDFLLAQVEDSRMRELKQGTAIGMGLTNGIARLRNSESKNKIVILITDGDSNVGAINPLTASFLGRQEGIKIYTIGIGKDRRVLVPIYTYDSMGRKTQKVGDVPSYLNPELLEQIARMTGGKSYMATDTGMLHRILNEIDQLEKSKITSVSSFEFFDLSRILGTVAICVLLTVVLLEEFRFRIVERKHAVSV